MAKGAEGREYVNIPLTGKLNTAVDGTELGKGDFQVLKNMRYGGVTPKSIGGMTKINSSIINATYLKPRQGFHFSKASPPQSHVLVQAYNTGLTESNVYENPTAIPTAGNFTATALWAETASTVNTGRFSNAPDGCMVYANGKDTCIWGGTEYRCGGFLVGDLEETIKNDFTERVTNTLTDSANVATIKKVGTASGNDANTVLLLNCDGSDLGVTFADTAVGHAIAHDATAVAAAHTSTDQFKFGTASGHFVALDYLTIADHADFLFSGGIWTVDMWIRPTVGAAGPKALYSHGTDADNYLELYANYNATFGWKLGVIVKATSVTVVDFTSDYLAGWTADTWHHVEFVENGNSWYIFSDGSIVASTTDTSRAADYTGLVWIGNPGPTNGYEGYIDEVRVSKVARHTSNFSVPTTPYGASTNAYVFIASTRPIKGIKWYVAHANATACVPTVSYWANSTWNSVSSLVDGTATVAGKSLSGTGSMTFTTTVGLAKPRIYNRVYAYWYLVTFPSIDSDTTVSYVTLDAPFQQIVDLWDGLARPIMQYFKYVSAYTDETANVLTQDYYSTDALTYSDLGAFATTSYLLCGFGERMTGIDITLAGGTANTTLGTVTVFYWNGETFVELGGVNDGTRNSSASLNQSGIITWDSPDEALEFKGSFSSSDNWYFYKLKWSSVTSATVKIDLITGVTTPVKIKSYSYPVMWQDRVWLLDEYSGKRNSALCSATATVCVFNGWDSTKLVFGGDEPLVCGATLFTRYGSSVYDNLVVFKNNELWIVSGTYPGDYVKWQVSADYGCVAPGTLRSCDLGYEIAQGLTKHILIWQAEDGICAFDGNAVIPISHDIANYFDKTKTECISSTLVGKSEAFYDPSKYEYHWLFASGSSATALNKEFVYDLLKKKWYEVDRGTGKYIQIGFVTRSTTGVKYTYGGIDTGYIERLDYGNTFDGTDIVSVFRTGDIPYGGWNFETKIRHVRLIAVAKATTTELVTITHYGECITTSIETVSIPYTVKSTTHRIVKPTETVNWGSYIFHSIMCSLTTDDEGVGFEPVGLGVIWTVTRESIL